jgi:hypothetical protein
MLRQAHAAVRIVGEAATVKAVEDVSDDHGGIRKRLESVGRPALPPPGPEDRGVAQEKG